MVFFFFNVIISFNLFLIGIIIMFINYEVNLLWYVVNIWNRLNKE